MRRWILCSAVAAASLFCYSPCASAACHDGLCQDVCRALGLFWSDGYHARNGCCCGSPVGCPTYCGDVACAQREVSNVWQPQPAPQPAPTTPPPPAPESPYSLEPTPTGPPPGNSESQYVPPQAIPYSPVAGVQLPSVFPAYVPQRVTPGAAAARPAGYRPAMPANANVYPAPAALPAGNTTAVPGYAPIGAGYQGYPGVGRVTPAMPARYPMPSPLGR